MVSRGRLLLLQQEVQLHRNLSENSSFSHLIYELGKHFEFIISVGSFNSDLIQSYLV